MSRFAWVLGCLCLAGSPVLAQDATTAPATTDPSVDNVNKVGGSSTNATATMRELLEKGYEIKAAVPSGTSKLVIFMQNEKSAYACEFTNVAKTRCGSIN